MALAERILHLRPIGDARTDKALVIAAKQGQKEAASALISRYYPRVHSFVSYLSDSRNADDLTQEVFTRALGGLSRFNGRYQFEPWLLRIARNLVIDEARRKRAMPVDPANMPEMHDAVASSDFVWDSMSRKVVNATIKEALERLPLRQRTMLVLREIEELSYSEIAQVMGTNVRGVEATLRRARERFRSEATEIAGPKASSLFSLSPLVVLMQMRDKISRKLSVRRGAEHVRQAFFSAGSPLAQIVEVAASLSLAGAIALAPAATGEPGKVALFAASSAPSVSLMAQQLVEQEIAFETLTPYGEANPLIEMHAEIEAEQMEERTKREKPILSLLGVNLYNPGVTDQLAGTLTDTVQTATDVGQIVETVEDSLPDASTTLEQTVAVTDVLDDLITDATGAVTPLALP